MEMQHLSSNPSSKRKHDESNYDSLAGSIFPQQDAQKRYVTSESSYGRNSPHRAIAGQFEELDIYPPPSASPGDTTAGTQASLEWACQNGDFQAGTGFEKNRDHSSLSIPHNRRRKNTPPKGQRRDIRASSPPTPSPSKQRSKPKQTSSHEPKKRCKSPPLTTETGEDDLTWHEWEITGHETTDPNDDGYGINGVGFKPTAAVVWHRSQERKKQVEGWRRRESREARDKRREKRDGIIREDDPSTSPSSKKKVAFVT